MPKVSEYGLVNVHIRTGIGNLLTPEAWAKINSSYGFQNYLQILSETAYAPIINAIAPENQTARYFSFAIRKRIPESFAFVEKNAPKNVQPLIRKIFQYYDVENLKVILRGIHLGDTWNKLKYLLFPTGNLPSLPYQAMVSQGSVEGAFALTRGSDFYQSLLYAQTRFSKEESLFPVEVLLDLDYWKAVWTVVQNLKGEDKTDASLLIGQILDKFNLIWAGRYQLFHQLQEAEIINYTMDFAPTVGDREIRLIANGTPVSEILEKLYPQLKGKVDPNLSESVSLSRWEVELDRNFARTCRRTFLGNPFHLAPVLAYLYLLEFEIRDLTLLAEAKTLNVPKERYMRYLINNNTPE